MSDRMIRRFDSVQVTIAAGAALSTDILELEQGAGLLIHMPAQWTEADLAILVAPSPAGTFQQHWIPKDDYSGNYFIRIPSPAAGKSYSFPAGVFPAGFGKLWSCVTADGGATFADKNQVAARTLNVDIKS